MEERERSERQARDEADRQHGAVAHAELPPEPRAVYAFDGWGMVPMELDAV